MELKTKVNKETILKKGMKPAEQKRQLRLESYMEKESKAKSFKKKLQYRRMMAENLPKDYSKRGDIIWVIKEIEKDYKKFEKVGIGFENSWRGKSGIINVITRPDRLIISRMQKPDKGEKPKEVKYEVTKQEINACLTVLGKLNIGDSIESKQIFMAMSRILKLGHSSWDSGDKPFETDRQTHNKWTTLLAYFRGEEFIKYSRGNVKLLNNKLSIQEILN